MSNHDDEGSRPDAGHDDSVNDAVEEVGSWLKRTLSAAEGGFYHLGYSSAQPGSWTTDAELRSTDHLDDFRLVAEGVRAHGSAESGQLVVVTDDQGDARSRCFTAFQIARLLGEGGGRVLVVDGDFYQVGVGDFLGDSDVEGFVDIVRYGVSLRSSLQRTGVNGVHLLGVGSFRPEESEPFAEVELRAALTQLRKASDFVLLVAPARLPDGSFNPLFIQADGVLLGVALSGDSREEFESTAEYLLGQGIPVYGVMAYTTPRESVDLAVDDALVANAAAASGSTSPYADVGHGRRERSGASSQLFRMTTIAMAVVLLAFVGWWAFVQWRDRNERASNPELARGPLTAETSDVAADGGDAADEAMSGDETRTGDAEPGGIGTDDATADMSGSGAGGEVADGAADDSETTGGAEAAKGADTRILAGGDTSGGPAGSGAPAPSTPPRTPPAEEPAKVTGAAVAESAARERDTATPSTEPPSAAPGGSEDAAAARRDDRAATTGGTVAGSSGGEDLPEPAEATPRAPATQTPTTRTPPPTQPSPALQSPTDDSEDELRSFLLLEPSSGYALHPWSFPDSSEALGSVRKLERQGMKPIVMGFEIKDKGRWFRVLVGEYPTRSMAMDARALLQRRTDVDYVGVVPVSR